MGRFVDLIAPKSIFDLFFKAIILVSCFTAVDYFVGNATAQFTRHDVSASLLVTFLIGAPFGLFVMSIMALQRKLKEELRLLSETDALTGLLNRRKFLEVSQDLLNSRHSVTILMIDVDHFKAVNDTYGHYAGDIALIQVSKHLRQYSTETDNIGRIGGEEFAIIVHRDGAPSINQTVDDILKPICVTDSDRDAPAFDPFTVTLSIGAANAVSGHDIVDLMRLADHALYRAKIAGRNQAAFHEITDDNRRDVLRNAN